MFPDIFQIRINHAQQVSQEEQVSPEEGFTSHLQPSTIDSFWGQAINPVGWVLPTPTLNGAAQGFGSMICHNSKFMTLLCLRALMSCGRRGAFGFWVGDGETSHEHNIQGRGWWQLKYLVLFTSETLGKRNPIWRFAYFFEGVGEKPPN